MRLFFLGFPIVYENELLYFYVVFFMYTITRFFNYSIHTFSLIYLNILYQVTTFIGKLISAYY